jgi:hypothetical protein
VQGVRAVGRMGYIGAGQRVGCSLDTQRKWLHHAVAPTAAGGGLSLLWPAQAHEDTGVWVHFADAAVGIEVDWEASALPQERE